VKISVFIVLVLLGSCAGDLGGNQCDQIPKQDIPAEFKDSFYVSFKESILKSVGLPDLTKGFNQMC
jgi:hypothetical protein